MIRKPVLPWALAPRRPRIGLVMLLLPLLAGPLCSQQSTQRRINQGVLFSEVFFGAVGAANASYIELYNRDRSNPVSLQGASLRLTDSTGLTSNFAFPQSARIPADGVVLLYDATAGNPGFPGTPTVTLHAVRPTQLNWAALQPGQTAQLCLEVPALGNSPYASRELLLGQRARASQFPPCNANAARWQGRGAPWTVGQLERVLLVDPLTWHPWYEPLAVPNPTTGCPQAGIPTPGFRNPLLLRMDGFTFGNSNSPNLDGTPLQPTTAVALRDRIFGSTPRRQSLRLDARTVGGRIASVVYRCHPDPARVRIRDSRFDRVLGVGAVLDARALFEGTDVLLGNATTNVGMSWSVTVPPTTSTGSPGRLSVDGLPLNEVRRQVQRGSSSTVMGPRLAVTRTLASPPTLPVPVPLTSGDASEIQEDAADTSNSGQQDLWCEIIYWGEDGFLYKGKMKNWPPELNECDGLLGDPLPSMTSDDGRLALGSNNPGEIDIIAFCYLPDTELYTLISVNPPAVGARPWFGLAPDPLIDAVIMGAAAGTLPLPTAPFYDTTTSDGIYYFRAAGLPPGTVLEMVGIQVDNPVLPTAVRYSPVATVTVL